jgi:hypothetical protein
MTNGSLWIREAEEAGRTGDRIGYQKTGQISPAYAGHVAPVWAGEVGCGLQIVTGRRC